MVKTESGKAKNILCIVSFSKTGGTEMILRGLTGPILPRRLPFVIAHALRPPDVTFLTIV